MTYFSFIPRRLNFGTPNREKEIHNCYGEVIANPPSTSDNEYDKVMELEYIDDLPS